MKKYFFIILALFLVYSTSLRAAENSKEETNVFGFPDKSFVASIDNSQPEKEFSQNVKVSCNDEKLLQQLRNFLDPYINKKNYSSAINRRRAFLIIKNLKNFEELDLKNINYQEDTLAADRLVELKINNKFSEEDIKICKASNRFIGENIYMIIYKTSDTFKVETINFETKETLSFDFNDNDGSNN